MDPVTIPCPRTKLAVANKKINTSADLPTLTLFPDIAASKIESNERRARTPHPHFTSLHTASVSWIAKVIPNRAAKGSAAALNNKTPRDYGILFLFCFPEVGRMQVANTAKAR